MKFIPVTDKYKFGDALTTHFPEYLKVPIKRWLKSTLISSNNWFTLYNRDLLKKDFVDEINLLFRERFPEDPEAFLNFILQDDERTTNILGLLLQNFTSRDGALQLERVLSMGGSAYSVIIERQDNGRSLCSLVLRVSPIVLTAAEESLASDSLIKEAWYSCYSRNPDYERTVSKAVDALEGLIRDKHFPLDNKPVLTKFVNDFVSNPNILSYKGHTLINPKNKLTDLAKEFIVVRGQHTSGTGRLPTKDEAEFVLHYVIFVWNLYR